MANTNGTDSRAAFLTELKALFKKYNVTVDETPEHAAYEGAVTGYNYSLLLPGTVIELSDLEKELANTALHSDKV